MHGYPQASCFMDVEDVEKLMCELPAPLGLKEHIEHHKGVSHHELVRDIQSLALALYIGEGGNLKVIDAFIHSSFRKCADY